ncbi:MAG: PilC/PilY family type IV pilus protein, partial [Gammaproteobacteria bacterium]
VYAGDLQGNLWKFDVNDVDPANWDVSFRDVSNVPEPLYIAKDSGGTRQPITVRPDVGRGPDGIGAMIYFGTGIYLQSTDLADTSSQTFYGLLDNGNQLTGRATSDLAPQTVILQSSKVFKPGDPAIDFRVTSDNAVGSRGWLMDLPDTGERSVSVPILRAGRIIFVTITPDANVCKSGGTSWLMELEALTGSRLPESPFDFDNNGDFVSEYVTVVVNYDINNDGVVDSNDTLNVPVSGKGFGALVPTPGVLANVDTEFKYTPNSVGGLELTRENPGPTAVGRQSWGQLR